MTEITTADELDALPMGSVVMYILPSEPDAPSVACRAVRGWQFLGDDPERRYLSQSLAPTSTPLRVLYRPDAPALSDAALIEEAARRGMTVMDAAEAARLRDGGDEHHTLDELYEYRMLYNAHAAQGWLAAGIPVVKSHRHSDGEPCFDGGWFIVSAALPTGQVSNHYRDEFWDLFDVPEVDLPPEYDGHTPQIAAERLRIALSEAGA